MTVTAQKKKRKEREHGLKEEEDAKSERDEEAE